MKYFDDLITFRGKIRGIDAQHTLDFSNVSDSAIENLAVAKAIIVLQDSIAREAKKDKIAIADAVAKLPETIDISKYVNSYNARTDKEAGVSTFEKSKKSVEKYTPEQLRELQKLIEAKLADRG